MTSFLEVWVRPYIVLNAKTNVDWGIQVGVSFVILFLLDRALFPLLHAVWSKEKADPKVSRKRAGSEPKAQLPIIGFRVARSCFLKSMADFLIVICAMPDVYVAVVRPAEAFELPWCTSLPCSLIAALHALHISGDFAVTADDMFHDAFVVLCLLPWMATYQSFVGGNLALFAMAGLPGMLTYSLRTATLVGVLSSKLQRQLLIACQLYVRAPLCSFAFALSWTSWVGGRLSNQALFTALLVLWNGAFVSQQMVEALLVRYENAAGGKGRADTDALLHAPLPYPASIAAAGRGLVRSISSGQLGGGPTVERRSGPM